MLPALETDLSTDLGTTPLADLEAIVTAGVTPVESARDALDAAEQAVKTRKQTLATTWEALKAFAQALPQHAQLAAGTVDVVVHRLTEAEEARAQEALDLAVIHVVDGKSLIGRLRANVVDTTVPTSLRGFGIDGSDPAVALNARWGALKANYETAAQNFAEAVDAAADAALALERAERDQLNNTRAAIQEELP